MKSKYALSTLFLILSFNFIFGFNNYEDIQEEYIPGKIIIKLNEDAAKNRNESLNIINVLISEIELHIDRKFPAHSAPEKAMHPSGQKLVDLSLIYEISFDDNENIDEIITRIYKTKMVEYAEKFYLPELFQYFPDDPLTSNQYYLDNIQAYDAWGITTGDTTQVIAIIDTGTDLLHPDLINNIKYNYDDPINGEDSDNDGYVDNFYGWDLGEGNNNPQFNANNHGVLVSGLAAATADNGTGIAGVGFNSKFLPVKIDDAFGRLVKSYEGIIYAADRGATVMNLSWGGALGAGQFGQDIINYAVLNRDVVVVAAAGNSNNQVRIYPAAYNNSLSIAATDANDVKWSGSSFGITIDMSAPGSGVLTTWPNSNYQPGWGTSFAAPIVAGAAALLRSYYPEYDALQIGAQLQVTTDNIDEVEGNEAYAGLLGTGRLNIFRALTESGNSFIKLVELEHPDEHYESAQPGSQVEIGAYFQNILAPAENITATIESSSQYLEIVAGEINIGSADTYEIINNIDQPFVINLLSTYPPSHKADFIIRFFNNGVYAGRAAYSLTMNIDYIDIYPNAISTTITSKGSIGYNYPNFSQGIGFDYNNTGRSLIKCAGLMIGNSTSQVVDNIYGASESSFNQFFVPVINAHIIENPEDAELEIKGSFNDSNAGAFMVDVKVDYSVKAWEGEPDNKYLILEYEIINTGNDVLNSLYAGFYADWIIQDVRNHRAAFYPDYKMGYAFSDAGGFYKGISLLSDLNVRHYAFDNQGFGGSLKISDGFTSFEKYTALKSNRNNAGLFDPDNDISTLVSTGPFLLNPNDTVTIAFALIAGDHLSDIVNSAEMAYIKYTGIEEDDDDDDDDDPNFIHKPEAGATDFIFYGGENPFGNKMTFSVEITTSTDLIIRISDLNGKTIRDIKNNNMNTGRYDFSINTTGWQQGMYLLQLNSSQSVKTIKMVKH